MTATAAHVKEDVVRMRVTAEQKQAFNDAAGRDGLELSQWLRQLALRAAGAIQPVVVPPVDRRQSQWTTERRLRQGMAIRAAWQRKREARPVSVTRLHLSLSHQSARRRHLVRMCVWQAEIVRDNPIVVSDGTRLDWWFWIEAASYALREIGR